MPRETIQVAGSATAYMAVGDAVRFEMRLRFPVGPGQVAGAVAAAAVLCVIVAGKADFTSVGGFASSGYGAASPGGFGLTSAFATEVVLSLAGRGKEPWCGSNAFTKLGLWL